MWAKVFAYMYRHWIITKRWPGETANLLVYPFIGLLSVGIFAFFMASKGGGPVEAVMFVLIGVIAWNFYEIASRGVTYGLTHDIWNDCLKHSFTTSVRSRHFIAGNALWGLSGSVFSLVTVGIVGLLAFGANVFMAGPFLAVNMLSIFIFAVGIGLMVNSLMVSKGEKWMALIWMMTGVIMIFSGVYYPIQVLPWIMQVVAVAMPPTHAIISVRSALGMEPAGLMLSEMLLGLGFALAFFLVGVAVFRYGLKKGRKNGIITKY
jgi:ABC-2 type transport system permease protein